MSQPVAFVSARDHRIDVIRGLALVMIFINHVPGTVYEHMTSRNFGFSDAAEAFVFLAGVSAALAYGRSFGPSFGLGQGLLQPMQAIAKPWKRAWTLYLVHLMLSLAVLALVAAVMRFGGSPGMILRDNFLAILEDPLGTYIGLPLLIHQFGYVNILPLYVVMLLAAPALLWLGARRPLLLLGASVGLWLTVGILRVNFPSYPTPYGWFLNPMSWQLLFICGLLTGLPLKEGKRFIPVHPKLIVLAGGYLAVSFLWVRIPELGALGRGALTALTNAGVPRVLTQFDKGYLELPRLAHVLALAYIASVLPALRMAADSPKSWALRVMGRQALPIFALGTALSFAARAVRHLLADAGTPPTMLVDTLLILGGIVLMLGFAALREWLAGPKGPKSSKAAPQGAGQSAPASARALPAM